MADAAVDTARTPGVIPGDSPHSPAHTRTKPRHWSVVAAACAAVVSGALAAGPAAGVVAASAPGAPSALPTASAPDPARTDLPLDCGPLPVKIGISFSADLGDGTPSTVVSAHCDSGGGTASDGVFLLTAGQGGHPVVRQTLVRWQEGLTITRLALRADGVLTATARGYSGDDVPRCCPDLTVALNWSRKGGSYVRSQSSAPSATA